MKTILIVLSLMLSQILLSQTIISGKVNYKNIGVKDVSVTLKDSYDGATTDSNGNYSFSTNEKGEKILIFSHPKYTEVEQNINLSNDKITANISLKEQINEIDAVVISAGSIEASDRKRATVLLSPIDIYTTAGADAQLTSALTYLPGVQKVGESEGLFIRGGTGTETKIFMDGSLINNYFTNSVPGIAGRDRFNTSLFKGNVFSSGGYSAAYGQALSGVLVLESVDLPETSSYDFGASPIFISGSFQKLSQNKNHSYGASLSYSNMGLMDKILPFNTNFDIAPQGVSSNANFRIKTNKGGIIKYYGSFDANKMAVINESNNSENRYGINASNTFHTLSYKQKLGKYNLNLSSSYSNNGSKLNIKFKNLNEESNLSLNEIGNYINFKGMIDRKINKLSTIKTGIEFNNLNEKNNSGKDYNDLTSSFFLESELGFSNHFSARVGVRTEHSSSLEKSNIAPRLALAYRLSKEWTTSLAYGIYYQNPESKYVNSSAPLDFQKAEHYILQVQKNMEGRNLRFEAFYKNYDHLIKTFGTDFIQTAQNNDGAGMAKGLEVFWRDKKTLKTIDYWVSYSYLDTERDFMNYPRTLTPTFAAKHTLSLVAKKFVTKWKTGFNASYSYSTGRNYYQIQTENNNNFILNSGKLKDYSALNFSLNYLPNLGKKDSKAFTVLVLSISNVLGNKNIYGYNFSQDGSFKSPILPPVKTFVFIGAFISFGVDRTNDAINNNL